MRGLHVHPRLEESIDVFECHTVNFCHGHAYRWNHTEKMRDFFDRNLTLGHLLGPVQIKCIMGFLGPHSILQKLLVIWELALHLMDGETR